MHEGGVVAIRRMIDRLVKAERDMRLAADAAALLAEQGGRLPSAREFFERLIVAYVRPYTNDSERKPLPDELLPAEPDQRQLHDWLVTLRARLCAHSDATDHRRAVDPFAEHGYTEAHAPLAALVYRRIAALAREQGEKIRRERERLEQQLGDAAVPTDPTI
jgi:hypothetical protein